MSCESSTRGDVFLDLLVFACSHFYIRTTDICMYMYIYPPLSFTVERT